jgi:hypothetical protein
MPRPGSTRNKWYRILELIHHAELNLPSIEKGVASIHRVDYLWLFSREIVGAGRDRRFSDAVDDEASRRAWERFKQWARRAGLTRDLEPDFTPELWRRLEPITAHLQTNKAGNLAGFLHIDIEKARAAAEAALPPIEDDERDEVEILVIN